MGATSDSSLQNVINKENEAYHDIVQGDFVDHYKNLSYKAIMGKLWVSEFCEQAEFVVKTDDDMYIAYLPLAHIFELMAEFACLAQGVCLCYADPKTLTATGSYPIGALEAYKPTLMIGVPKIWDVIKKGAQAKIAAESSVKQYLVNTAFEARARARKLSHRQPKGT